MPKRSSRKDAILEVYATHGGAMSVRHLAQLCWEEEVWSLDEQRHMAFTAAKREVHNVLQAKDAQGLPVAGPSTQHDGQARIWLQLDLWDYATAQLNLGMRLQQVEKDYATIEAIARYMEKRWGHAPPIPTLAYPEEAPVWWLDAQERPDEDEDD